MAIKISGSTIIDDSRNIVNAGIITADGSGLVGISTNFVSAIGIQSAGTVVGAGITQLNFIGAGNTFAINGTTVDISISGSGGGSGGVGSFSELDDMLFS